MAPPPTASPPAPDGAAAAAPASFAESTATGLPPTAADAINDTLGAAGDRVLADWMQRIAAMVSRSANPQALRDTLLQAYGDLPTEQLQEVMALAYAAAELAGMSAVADEIAGDEASGKTSQAGATAGDAGAATATATAAAAAAAAAAAGQGT